MKAVQMTMEPELIAQIDEAVRKLGTTRSAFAREALRAALAKLHTRELERRHREGYRKHPVQPGEFDEWETEQVWPE